MPHVERAFLTRPGRPIYDSARQGRFWGWAKRAHEKNWLRLHSLKPIVQACGEPYYQIDQRGKLFDDRRGMVYCGDCDEKGKMIRQGEKPLITIGEDRLAARYRLLGFLPLTFFLAHALYYVRHGGLGHTLWMCNVGNLLLAAGLLLGRPLPVQVAVFWLIPGLPLWLYFVVMRGGWLLTSTFAHVGGLGVGLLALAKVRADRRGWLYAFGWFLLVQQVCRLITPAELNVNVAHRVYGGWERVFSAYWQFWLATTAAMGTGLWVMGIILTKLLPPAARS